MSDFKLACPACHASLNLARPLDPGQSVRCPKCQALVPAARTDANVVAEDVEVSQAGKPLPKSAKAGSAWILISVILLAVVLGGGIVFLILNKERFGLGSSKNSWKADADAVEKLAEETGVQNYKVRPPDGCKFENKGYGASTSSYTWTTPARGDGTKGVFAVSIGVMSEEQSDEPLEKQMKTALKSIAAGKKSWKQSEMEKGKINGIDFVRAHWNCAGAKGKQIHGFCYVAMGQQILIQLNGQDQEPHHETFLKVAEAAALTFRK